MSGCASSPTADSLGLCSALLVVVAAVLNSVYRCQNLARLALSDCLAVVKLLTAACCGYSVLLPLMVLAVISGLVYQDLIVCKQQS